MKDKDLEFYFAVLSEFLEELEEYLKHDTKEGKKLRNTIGVYTNNFVLLLESREKVEKKRK